MVRKIKRGIPKAGGKARVSGKKRSTEMIYLDEVVRKSKCPCCLKEWNNRETDVLDFVERGSDEKPRRWVWRLCSRCAKRELARKPGEESREEGPRAKRESMGRSRAVAIVQWAIGLAVDVEDVLGQAGRALGLRRWRLLGGRDAFGRLQREAGGKWRGEAIATFRERRRAGMSIEKASEGLTRETTENAPFPSHEALAKAAGRTK